MEFASKPIPGDKTMKQKGFVLLTSILVILLMLAAMSYVHLKTVSHIKTTQYAEKQMSSMMLAEIGMSKARQIISKNDINVILAGKDGTGSAVPENLDLNPIDPVEARTIDFTSWRKNNDDGYYRYSPARDQLILLKISNNSAEPPFADLDGRVTVRSLGIIKNGLLESEIPEIKNQVTILEGIFRKETPFILPSPLVFLDPASSWIFEGDEFQIKGGEVSSILLLGKQCFEQFEALKMLADELKPECRDNSIPFAAIGSETNGYPNITYLSSPAFWEHFRSNISKFGINIFTEEETRKSEGLFKYSSHKYLKGDYSGILVTSGDVTLTGNFSIEGLILHLGGGSLDLRQHSSVKGAVLYIANEDAGNSLIKIQDQARIIYDRSAIENAQRYLPVTHLGTRIIYK
jgi:hypothetical protein